MSTINNSQAQALRRVAEWVDSPHTASDLLRAADEIEGGHGPGLITDAQWQEIALRATAGGYVLHTREIAELMLCGAWQYTHPSQGAFLRLVCDVTHRRLPSAQEAS